MKRRTFIGGIAAAGVAVAAGLYRFTDLVVKHYPPTPFDDVLAQIVDRQHAAILGRKVAGPFDVPREAQRLRTTLAGATVEAAVTRDIAIGRMTEADGWIVPTTVAQLAALAARA